MVNVSLDFDGIVKGLINGDVEALKKFNELPQEEKVRIRLEKAVAKYLSAHPNASDKCIEIFMDCFLFGYNAGLAYVENHKDYFQKLIDKYKK